MLKIRTYLNRSTISGIGIFADEHIPKGKVIWEFNCLIDFVFTKEKWGNLKDNISPESFSQIEKYSYKSNGLYYLCTDNAQFMNHGKSDYNICNNFDDDTMFAMRDIAKGEELICNYYEYCDADDVNLEIIRKLEA